MLGHKRAREEPGKVLLEMETCKPDGRGGRSGAPGGRGEEACAGRGGSMRRSIDWSFLSGLETRSPGGGR